ncbi:hypothetical protein TWF730_010746 [Orbilia blumenaviensis]|uniref:Uncharacterized protein n=1 Tax=Orbilia blumenaviensis TaxID=1796055 RepID=A0AAV9UQP8_9PEZI
MAVYTWKGDIYRIKSEHNDIHFEGAQEWRRTFFKSSEFRALQESKIRDIFQIPGNGARYSARQDSKKTQPPGAETRDWYDFHFPTGAVLFPFDFEAVPNPSSNSTNASKPPYLQLKRLGSERKRGGGLNGISVSNYRRIQDLKRGDRIILPNDSQIHILNKGVVPKGVLIVSRIGAQEGSGYAALQVRTFIDLKLYEFILPHHIRSLHLVETETNLMIKQSPNVLLPGYFVLRHAYLLKLEVEDWQHEDPTLRSKFPLYRFELAFIAENGTITKQKFLCPETVHESVERLNTSWQAGHDSREADFSNSKRWTLWLLKYIPSSISSQSKHMEARWTEAGTYQMLGWSFSGVLATGSVSMGAIQTSELTAATKVHEDNMYRLLGRKRTNEVQG